MATSLQFSTLSLQTTRRCHDKRITRPRARSPPYSLPLAINWSGKQGSVRRSIHPRKNTWILFCNNHPIKSNGSDTGHSDDLSHDAFTTVDKFYGFINDKKLDEMHALIADHCFFEELSYPHPFHSGKEVIHFLDELIEAMGKDVKFKTEKIYKEGHHAAGVTWHLEWKGTEIPFTKGCSFYECSKDKEGRLVIE